MKTIDANKTYLITGAAGFIGYHLSKRLIEAGARVIGFDNMNDYYDVSLKEERLRLINKAVEDAKKSAVKNADSSVQSCGSFVFIIVVLIDPLFVDQHRFFRKMRSNDTHRYYNNVNDQDCVKHFID